MSKKVADIIVETLQSAGVRHCYGVVGDTLNLIAGSLERSKIEWVSVRHEEAGAFAAQAEAQVTGHLTAVAGAASRQPAFHQRDIRGQSKPCAGRADRKPDHPRRAGLRFHSGGRLQASLPELQRLLRHDLYGRAGASQDRHCLPNRFGKTCVAVLIVPADVSASTVHEDVPYSVHVSNPVVRPSDADLTEIADILNKGEKIAVYGGSGCQEAHKEILAVAES